MFGDFWTIKDEIRAMVQFRKRNFILPFAGLGKFDIIFCRNVAIYFTLPDRQKLFNKIADNLAERLSHHWFRRITHWYLSSFYSQETFAINILSEKINEVFFMKNMTILVVDDDPVIRRMLEKRLEKEGYEVLC